MDTHEAKIYTAILIAAIILGIILIYFILTIISYHRRHINLYKEKIRVEITTLEKERKRMASDLHDDLGPVLSAVKFHIDCLNTMDKEDVKIIVKTKKYIDDILKKVRETSNNLMPSVLIRKGLLLAIEEFAGNINSTNALKVVTDFTTEKFKISSEKEIHIYRIIQEVMNNALKYSQAATFTIRLIVEKKILHLQMSDDGNGFDYKKELNEGLGLGLKSILSRVEILDGEMYLETKPGKGVLYIINIPLTT